MKKLLSLLALVCGLTATEGAVSYFDKIVCTNIQMNTYFWTPGVPSTYPRIEFISRFVPGPFTNMIDNNPFWGLMLTPDPRMQVTMNGLLNCWSNVDCSTNLNVERTLTVMHDNFTMDESWTGFADHFDLNCTNDYNVTLYQSNYSGLNLSLTTFEPVADSLLGASLVIGNNTNLVANPRGVTIAGGVKNMVFGAPGNGSYSFIGGGLENNILGSGTGKAIVGGSGNVASGTYAFIGGGFQNSIAGSYAAAVGGFQNASTADYSVMGGGYVNVNGADYSGIFGGRENQIVEWIPASSAKGYSIIGGGSHNLISTNGGTVDYGHGAFAPGYFSTIAGGGYNRIEAPVATIGGGGDNTVFGAGSGIFCGDLCMISTNSAQCFLGGGVNNTISNSSFAVIAGGAINFITNSAAAFIGGGQENFITNGDYSVIPGGKNNTVAANYSFAAGYNATAHNIGSFVWHGGTVGSAEDTAGSQFVVSASGNMYFKDGVLYASGGAAVPTHAAPTGVTVGTTAPDIWFEVKDASSGTSYYVPGWSNH